uniref:Proton-activated chloride channel n=1 Tax=Leptobrachium leishanense TaxID=445787 RepID=A0A8C5MID7_9ANUR
MRSSACCWSRAQQGIPGAQSEVLHLSNRRPQTSCHPGPVRLPSAMIRKEISRSYQELNDETEQGSGGAAILEDMEEEDNDDQGDTGSTTMPGIALYPGNAELLSCEHHFYDHIPKLKNPGQPGENKCVTRKINYTDPFTNQTMKNALIVEGPRDVRKRELVYLQFHLNETKQDFSAIDYLLFSSYQNFLKSSNKTKFMQDCESSFSSWKFSGGFRTWVKMSLVKTTEEDGSESVEFRQETSVVNYIDRRSSAEKGDQLFFVVFAWKDPYIQEIQDIVTANPWSMIALLCGVFLVLFKAADFAKLSVKWMIKIRKRHLKKRARELNHIS